MKKVNELSAEQLFKAFQEKKLVEEKQKKLMGVENITKKIDIPTFIMAISSASLSICAWVLTIYLMSK